MKKYRFKIILILALIGLGIYFLYPTIQDYFNTKEIQQILAERKAAYLKEHPNAKPTEVDKYLTQVEDSIRNADPSIKKAREKRIKLGLDLQGGMYIVLEVNTLKLLEKLAKNPDENFYEMLRATESIVKVSEEPVVQVFAQEAKKRGIRLSRYFGEIRDDDDKIISMLEKQAEDAVTRAQEIIRNRVDQYGVSEPSIHLSGSRRIIVELPGVARKEEARQLLQGTALLEFNLVKDPEFTFALLEKINKVLAGKPIEDTTAKDTTKADTTKKSPDQMSQEEFAKEYPLFTVAVPNPQSQTADLFVRENDKSKVELMLSRPEVQNVIPKDVKFVWSAKPEFYAEGQGIYRLYCVKATPELTGGVIVDARATLDPQTSSPIVTMEMNAEGARDWARITGNNIDKRIAIILDGVVFSAPTVRSKITGGRSQIENIGTLEEAKLLEIVLKAGALPAPVEIIEERVIGPSLGQDSIQKGLTSALLGGLLVIIFMAFWYRTAGTIADFAVLLNVFFILSVLAGFGATLTLPGIAGIILTIGMAVDANVLVNERVREELKTGKTIKAAIDAGYSKAFSAIFDGNITTFFTGLILYQFGSGPIQGFALTLMIGIAATLFTQLFITRLIFDVLVEQGKKPNFG
ncbi:MAG: protein translocase subunit SecD [Ignavibacteria bacterium]|nr:protein translocase subunit SecD [Ignavibacteria bacterium]